MQRTIRLAVVLLAFTTLARAQAINLDLGQPGAPRPIDAYRGVGLAGTWNKLDAIDTGAHFPLYGLGGALLPATLHQIGGTEIVTAPLGGAGEPAGDDAILLGDALVTHTATENCLFFDGLAAGTYEVVTYAWMPTAPPTPNRVRIDNNPTTTTVGGSWSGALAENVIFARHFVAVTSAGTLGIHSGVPSGGNYTTGAALNAVQIRRLEVSPPLFVDRGQVGWLASAGANRYDIVVGSLGALRATHGDFAAATQQCLANDLADTHFAHAQIPEAGDGAWFLVRGVGTGGALTWDEPAGSQAASRDPGINAAAARCP